MLAVAPALQPEPEPETARIFVKVFEVGVGLRFRAATSVPQTRDVELLLPRVLAALPAAAPPLPEGESWSLVCEGSPCDWAEEPPLEEGGVLRNSRGVAVDGDTLVLCRRSELAGLEALLRGQYERRVGNFATLHQREAAQPGSVEFADLCQVMDELNVDVWRLEQLVAAGTEGGDVPPPRQLLAAMQSLPGLHPQFFCDGCGTREVRGFRFNCLECSDFDLCAACYEKQHAAEHSSHSPSHEMARLRPALPEGCLGTPTSA
mmetsp:Transcript_63381/g.137207  ORF Transcript_63381/g.137207 Transcript_63381/m.137207 type:complete len:262 (-) Transcript_63381:530-1315(-)